MKHPTPTRKQWTLWLPVFLAFVLLIAAWTTLIKIAADHPTERIHPETAQRD
ncbi:MAG: hypothetical protein AAFX93_10750 [Verrucomicrobiota bacterium]